ncbi:phosphatidylinositol 3 [Xylariales sp. AK1849]|nr:phosphatidylinositol 3 [Xylariales sp. AK1849]
MAPSSARPREPRVVTVKQAVDAIEAGKQKDRVGALDDLIYLFSRRAKFADPPKLGDKDYHRTLDALFRCAVSEKHTYYGAKKGASTTASATRLAKCAEALRVVIEHGASKLKRKTLLAVVDHITQTLPGPEEDFVEPLRIEYIKALAALLGHSANVELLATYEAEGWYTCVDFIIQAIDHQLESGIAESTPSRASPAPGTSQPFSFAASTLRSTATSSTQRRSSRVQNNLLHHILDSLHSLVSAPNAPVRERSKIVTTTVLQCLKLRSLGMTAVLQLSFAVLNTVLTTIQTDDVEQTNSIVSDLIPLVSQCWQAKTTSQDNALLNSIQVEVLKMLFNVHLNIEYLVQLGDSRFVAEIEDFCDMLWSEYARRDDRAQLQQDDLTYSSVPQHAHSFKTPLFRLRLHNVEAERRWAIVHILALYEAILWKQSRSQHVSPEEQNEQPRKKRRTTTGSSRLRQKLQSPEPAVQFTALQIIPFFICNARLASSDLAEVLSLISNLTGHKNAKLSIWSMIAAASLTKATLAAQDTFLPAWKQFWYMAARNLSMPGSCRASCILLGSIISKNLIPYHEISDDVNNIVTAADVSGPAIVVDSSILLMTKLLQLRNYKVPGASYATCSHVVRWLFLRWDPADPTFISSSSTHVAPLDIVNLLRAAYGISSFTLSGLPQLISGPIGEAWILLRERETVVRYLLLLENPDSSTDNGDSQQGPLAHPVTQMAETSDSHAIRKLVAELLHPKLEDLQALCDSWTKRGDGSSQISADKLRSLLNCLLVVAFNLPHLTDVSSRQSQGLDVTLFKLLSDALRTAWDASDSRSLYEAVLKVIRPYIPSCSTAGLSCLSKDTPQLFELLSELSDIFRDRNSQQSLGSRDDAMDLDDGFESQESHPSTVSKVLDISRRESPMLDAESFYSDTVQRLRLLKVLHQDPGQIGLVPTEFLDSLLELPDEEFLSCRFLNHELFTQELIISQDAALRVTERIADIIGTSVFSSCEVALHCCLGIVEGFITMWTGGTGELSALVGQLYHHFITKALPNNLLSRKTQTALARLLFRLTEIDERFPETVKLPTTIVSLLSILQQCAIGVKFYIGRNVSRLFGRFVLKTHDQVCIDVIEKLPQDPGVSEGIALRLFVLSELAQEWPTLLRRCVYHIFETPGIIRTSTKHATYCLKTIAAKLELESAQGLFELFAPQLLYTWLDGDVIEKIPFDIFGFANLEELLKRSQSEATALMIMRGQETEVADLAKLLGISPVQLVESCFSKIMAYSIAHDISIPNPELPTGESRIRKMMGREPFLQNVYINFADIIGLFFSLVDQEDPVEKAWGKDESFAYAAEAMAEIKKYAHSEVELAANQQPHFHAKYLTREMALLCSRTEYEMHALWTPALVVAVARRLFNMIHVALGPLHACSVIRKVRVLICLAGPRAWESYPLEMLLHSLRPHLVDPTCADDALGMSQYLLTRGSSALAQSPSFLAGYALSTLASLRVFLESSQASTTQESQFKATMSKAQKFHAWLSKYLEVYESPVLRDEQQSAAFKAITRNAAHVRSSGNAERGSHESNLLLEILRDEGSNMQLLNGPSRNLALDILCKDFKIPASFRSDTVNSDGEAMDIATAVWKSCCAQSRSEQYLMWAGRVIGRGFAASGDIDSSLIRESKLTQYLRFSSAASSSEQGLLALLQSLASDRDYYTAGLAESALRSIVSEAAGQEDNALLAACQNVITDQLLVSSDWNTYRTPPSDECQVDQIPENLSLSSDAFENVRWPQRLAIRLTQSVKSDIVLRALPQVLASVNGFAEGAFPFIVHLVLLSERDKQQSAKRALSVALKDWLSLRSPIAKDNLSLMINTILYLRTQKLPKESSIADRSQWLDLEVASAASAAAECGLYRTALLFIESSATEGSRTSRRSSAVRAQESTDVLLDIFENIDDPDAYYGLRNNASLTNVLARLEYENDSSKSLAFRGAQFDSHIRRRDPAASSDERSLVSTLSNLGLSGLSHSLIQNQQDHDGASVSVDATFHNARRLEIWNLPAPSSTGNPTVTLYKAYQACYQAVGQEAAQKAVYNGLSQVTENLVKSDMSTASIRRNLGTLAALTELDDVMNALHSAELDDMLTIFEERSKWMKRGRYADVSYILSTRETTLSMLGQTHHARPKSTVTLPDSRLVEIRSMLLSSNIYRFHQANQESLNLATSLSDLINPSLELGLTLDAAAKLEAANSLWDHSEMVPSIRMLQSINEDSDLKKQTVQVNRSDLLAKIGYQVSVARLEKPDSIQKNYLQPALKELKGKTDGQEAGKVYHQFAMFCDEQLQNQDGLEDLARLQHLRQGKSDEVSQLKGLMNSARDSQVRERYKNHLTKAKQWLELDEQELRRVEQSRSEFVRLSLENYLLSLTASDEHNNDALRFTALWLERSGEDFTNDAVRKYIEKVPTRKFAPLMNQLTSRLLDQGQLFQKLLIDLVYRICVDHPYHGMYQIWSGTKSRTNSKDDVAVLRQKATERVSKKLAQTQAVQTVWRALDKTSKAYHGLAVDRDNARYKAGNKMAIKECNAGNVLIASLAQYHIPPPTMQIELSPNKDYSNIPHVIKLEPSMTIASGVSAPKIITLVGSNGKRFKQLVKGGSDDLRQDAIMEQVFSAASSVLKLHRSAQQRNLGIRTYKVLPLTASSGLIEFVPDTIPLHEYLMPAHERYHPKDLKGSGCRKEIAQVQSKSVETRLATYKKVCDRFQPVMRYFFMEYFVDPDDWYAKRTAYTRTTAAISILGHVLGLGDRHGHNILLDSVTGEVVHIDLGVAFEMGRVLPVPELVPFRLTRDIVDGMGVTKTEGVFRRCCEFTLDALREETYSIMTILDVLRYDPLYSWSISPVRMAKLQDTRRDEEAADDGPNESEVDLRKKKGNGAGGVVNEPSEADRALEVVRKKLSKTLSVTATVNDLINQAMDERNLAVLYSGWAAYA